MNTRKNDILKRYIEIVDSEVTGNMLSPKTAKIYKRIAERLVVGEITDTNILSFSYLLQIEAVMSCMRDYGIISARHTFGLHLKRRRAKLREASRERKIEREQPEYISEQVWSKCELDAVRAYLPDTSEGQEVWRAIEIASETGMRKFEILKIQPADILVGELNLRITVTGKMKKRRYVYAPRIPVLLNFIPFTIGVDYLTTTFRRALKKAGLEKRTFHGLRHTYSSENVQDGVDVLDMQGQLGHSKLETTMIYLHKHNDCPQSLINRWRKRGLI